MLIFYSWLSDLPNNTNRSFVQNALEKAARNLSKEEELSVVPRIDQDTAGIPGAPDIASAIFSKIDETDIFVGDVSIINKGSSFRPSPNPNVLVELGYALKGLSWKNVILVMNITTGAPNSLPFDLQQKRVISYDPTVPKAKELLTAQLQGALRNIAESIASSKRDEDKSLTHQMQNALAEPRNEASGILLATNVDNLVRELSSPLVIDMSAYPSPDELHKRLDWVNNATSPLLRMCAVVGRWVTGDRMLYFRRALIDLASLPEDKTSSTRYQAWEGFRFYPATRFLYALGISAVQYDNYALLRALVVGNFVRDGYRNHSSSILSRVNATHVLTTDLGRLLPGKERHKVPWSAYFYEDMAALFSPQLGSEERFASLFDRFEYLMSIVYRQESMKVDSFTEWAPIGMFAFRRGGEVISEITEEFERDRSEWMPIRSGLFESPETFELAREAVTKRLHRL